ncbi:MAG: TetR/AcrR family transcriptional regulator [Acidimicrobiales bacterium]|jgi:AcrR family transcriptional regulator
MPRVTDAHRESRRRQILDASVECFAREGFHRSSMAQIIAEAGVSAGTIYLYFTSKEEIVEAIAEERHALESALASAALANPDTAQALHDLAAGYLDWLSDPLEQKRRRVTVQVWAEALRSERVASIVRDGVGQRHQVADFVRERQQRGELIPSVDADALSRAMLSLILGFVLQQAWDPTLDVAGYRTVLDAMIDQFLVVDRRKSSPDQRRQPSHPARRRKDAI